MRAPVVLSSVIALTLMSVPVARSQTSRAGGERLGKVHFETSCAAAVAEEFDHAMALLHSFEFFCPRIDQLEVAGAFEWDQFGVVSMRDGCGNVLPAHFERHTGIVRSMY